MSISDDGGIAVALWAGCSLCLAVSARPSLLLAARTDLVSLVRSLHVTNAAAMLVLGACLLIPRRADRRITCEPRVAAALTTWYYVYAGLVGCCALSGLVSARRRTARLVFRRLLQALLLALCGSMASHRLDGLCLQPPDSPKSTLIFAIVYSWAFLAFALCDRIEETLAAEAEVSDTVEAQPPRDSDDSDDDEPVLPLFSSFRRKYSKAS